MRFLQNLFRRIPAIIKVAQIVCQALEIRLPYIFDNVGADTFSAIEEREMLKCVRRTFGGSVQQSDLRTIGCGTIGRVYRYKNYALKVRIPGALERVERDLAWIENLSMWLDWATMYSFFFHRKIRTVHASICRQNDFKLELENSLVFARQMRNIRSELVFVPRFYPELSHDDMIVMDFVEGVTVASLRDPAQDIPSATKDELHKLLVYNLVHFRTCHADLHVGNLILEAHTGRLAVIDFGMCTPRLRAEKLVMVLRMLQAARQRDAIAIAKLIALEYHVNNDETRCVIDIPDMYNDLEYEIVRTVHNSYDSNDLRIVKDCFRAAANWSMQKNAWGTRDMADIEVAAIVSLTNLSFIGFKPEIFRAHVSEILKNQGVE